MAKQEASSAAFANTVQQQIVIASYQVAPPQPFNFKAEEWPKWIQRFERFRKATGLDDKTGENQVNTLIYSMGEQADDIFVILDNQAKTTTL